jgi:hypothetical protein
VVLQQVEDVRALRRITVSRHPRIERGDVGELGQVEGALQPLLLRQRHDEPPSVSACRDGLDARDLERVERQLCSLANQVDDFLADVHLFPLRRR